MFYFYFWQFRAGLGLVELPRVDRQLGKLVISIQVFSLSLSLSFSFRPLIVALFVMIDVGWFLLGYNASDSDSDDLKNDEK